ncbi:uncharacterized protein [Amphiura filiformis]|uniref:uncharacterized protein n=1 Tax=Amphiura filiformis TaxID=82378 RepID=UPI003B2150AE
MSALWNSSIGIYAITAVLAAPLILLAKKKWGKQEQGSGYHAHIILMSRYPKQGTTKTRLIGELGEQGAARVQNIMSDYMLDQLLVFQELNPCRWVEVKYHGGSQEDMDYWLGWRKKSKQFRMSWSEQDAGHLGQKMAGAFNKAFEKGAQRVVIIGSDIPGITPDLLTSAMSTLRNNGEMIIGPAKDGGYYLVGLNTKVYKHLRDDVGSLFEGMDWGTEKVFNQQKQVAESHGIKVEDLSTVNPSWILQDVDYPEDLGEFEKIGISVKQIKEPVLSIIIPVLNEANNIAETLSNVFKNCSYPKYTEIIVSDGGSTDDTAEKVEEFARTNTDIKIKLVKGIKGRGKQQNSGVKEASGDNFLFLHADTRLPPRFDQHILINLGIPGVAAGAFGFELDIFHDTSLDYNCSWFFKLQMRAISFGANIRAKYFELPYGDQALFMSRQKFDAVRGFSDFPLMEDYELVKKLQKEGHIKIVEDDCAITSARRWMKLGCLRTTGLSNILVILYNLGVHPNTLAKWYYGK